MPFGLLKYGLSKDYPFEKEADLPAPTALKRRYDVVIIGGGGHGVATAYYLANITASLMSPFSRKAILVAAIRREIRPSFAPTTSLQKALSSTVPR